MKEITRIHLAALPYNIEVAAKKELEKYLHAIESSLGADSDAMREIESRITEIPVSYTHLDVYKRQRFFCSSSAFLRRIFW